MLLISLVSAVLFFLKSTAPQSQQSVITTDAAHLEGSAAAVASLPQRN